MRRVSFLLCIAALLLSGCSSDGIVAFSESNGPTGAREFRLLPFKANTPGACCDDAAKPPTPAEAKQP
jgi:hypothetical protein